MKYLAFFFLLAFPSKSTFTGAQNVGCAYDSWYRVGSQDPGSLLQCVPTHTNAHFSLPGNFDVLLLGSHKNLTTLEIHSNYDNKNVVYANYTPFPALEKLTSVVFYGFNQQPEHPPFPLHGLLRHNTHHIQVLSLYHTKLLSLTKADFTGFAQLREITIENGKITSISRDVFEGLGVLPSGQLVPDFRPNVTKITIAKNEDLTSLDWSFLKPISASLKVFELHRSGVTADSLTCSIPFILSNATGVIFTFNSGLTRLPSAVYQTFNTTAPTKIFFCPYKSELSCDCCGMAEFAKWLRKQGQIDPLNGIACPHSGASSRDFVTNATFYDHCPR